MNIEQKKQFLINIAYISVVLAGIYLAFQYLLPIVLPFILGLLVAYIVIKIIRKINVDGKWVRVLLTILLYLTIGFVIFLLIVEGISFLKDVVVLIPNWYEEQLIPFFELLYKNVILFANGLDPNIYGTIELIWENLLTYLNDLISVISTFAVNVVSNTVTTVPSLFISLLMMIISSVFFVLDYDNMTKFYQKHVNEKWKNRIGEVRLFIVNTIFVVFKSYILIMVMTFSEISILFLLLKIDNPFLMATIIAIFDIMPVLGSGGILIPWALISLFTGNMVLAIKLIVVYGVITIVRNYVEPKVVGGQLGLHPIISLISMFVGLRLFGFIGMFGLPITISFFWKQYLTKKQNIPLE